MTDLADTAVLTVQPIPVPESPEAAESETPPFAPALALLSVEVRVEVMSSLPPEPVSILAELTYACWTAETVASATLWATR